jgi:hypothetical protein
MLPKFLVADNTDLPEAIFILHTEYPRFIVNLENDEVDWFDALEKDEETDLEHEVAALLVEAEEFYQREVDRYESLS